VAATPRLWDNRVMISPRALAARCRAMLRAAGDPDVAAQARTYFKQDEEVRFFGVDTKGVRGAERSLRREVRGLWGIAEAQEFSEILVRSRTMEEKNVGLLLLSRYRRSFPADLPRRTRAWIDSGCISNWAATDALCGWILGPFLMDHAERIPEVARWARSRLLWRRRAGAVSLIPLARRGIALGAAYDVADVLLADREDLIHKATGWLLREAGKTDPARLEAYLAKRGPAIPRTALRYAIERFPERRRQRLLERTRTIHPKRGSA